MKRLLPLVLISLFLSTGCQKNNKNTSSFIEPHYEEVEELHIEWKDLLNQKEEQYFAYVYSVTCTPCSMLRAEVISFAKEKKTNFYFIYPSDDIPFTKDENLADASLGKNRIEDVYCYSTPTLIGIDNKTITKYSRDYYEIKGFIESYK